MVFIFNFDFCIKTDENEPKYQKFLVCIFYRTAFS